MPLVRVSGSDVESFDTFDVAEMTDSRSQQSQRSGWPSRQPVGGTTASTNFRHGKNQPSCDTDDLTSIDSSGRRSEETDRVGSIPPRGSFGGASVGSTSVSISANSDNVYQNPYNSHVPIDETTDNIDELQNDPRNPFMKSHNSLRSNWEDYIPEEDETSHSTMEDSSQSPHVQQQSRPNSQQMYQPQTRSNRRQKQKYTSDGDDVSVASNQSYRPEFNKKSSNESSQNLIQQLEAQVAKLNFDLATTKSSLDELRLENRRLMDDKDKLTNDTKLVKEENDQLHLKIERLEKEMEREKILRNMEGTKGVVARQPSDHASCVVWSGNSVSGNTWAGNRGEASASSKQNYIPVTTKTMGKTGIGTLEVPFRTQPRRSSAASLCSSTELSVYGDNDVDHDCKSAHSIALSASDPDLDGLQLSDSERMRSFEGGESEKAARNVEDAYASPTRSRTNKKVGKSEIEKHGRPSPQKHHFESDEDGDNGIGSNPQGETFNDDDPFATWSAPGDPKRKEPQEQNWLQRGLGGRGRNRQPPQSTETIQEDPFDSCTQDDDDSERYTSFADKSSDCPEPQGQDRKRFGMFKGFMGGGRK
ncbi:hypothetical protein ACHAWF_018606 [Thalassiosira exigua]